MENTGQQGATGQGQGAEGANAQQQQGQGAAQQAPEVHPLDLGMDIPFEDEGFIDFSAPSAQEAGTGSEAGQQEAGQQQQGQGQAQGQGGQGAGEGNQGGGQGTNELKFDDNTQGDTAGQEETPDELIAKLKAKGYEVQAPVDPLNQKQEQITQLDSQIAQAQAFLQKPEEERIKIGLADQLSRTYKAQGKEHLLKSEQFDSEFEAALQEIKEAGFIARTNFLNSVDQGVNAYLADLNGKKNTMENEVQTTTRDRQLKNRQNLQESIRNFHQSGFMGQEVSTDVAKRAYDRIVTGQLQKDVSSDHNLISEFALYLEMKAQLGEKLGQPNYGEGVKAAVDHIISGDQAQTAQNPLDKAMRAGAHAGRIQQGVPTTDGRFQTTGTSKEGQNVVETAGSRF